jgi:hypothetical protein
MEEPGFDGVLNEEAGLQGCVNHDEELQGEEGVGMGEEDIRRQGCRMMMNRFQKYVEEAKQHNLELTRPFVAAVKLIKMPADRGCSLSLYDEIMKQHVENLDGQESVSRDVLMKKLCSRYIFTDAEPGEKKSHVLEKECLLPSGPAEKNAAFRLPS